MRGETLISVAMCTYNGEKYIREQLISVINQSLPPDELVICDDLSTDNTVDIIKNILKRWNGKLKLVVNQQNLGFSKNFEKAINLCAGDYIFLCDQDDVWDLNKISIIMGIFNSEKDAALVFHDAMIVDEQLRLLKQSFWDCLNFNYKNFIVMNYSHLSYENIIQGCACAFKKTVFEKAKPFPEFALHDEWLGLVGITLGKVIPVPHALLQYRQSSNNALGAGKVSYKEKIQQWFYHYDDIIKKRNNNLMRRLHLLSYYNQRFLKSFQNDEYDNNIFFVSYSFLRIREEYVRNRKVSIIRYLPLYFKLIPANPIFCLKEFAIDFFLILFGISF